MLLFFMNSKILSTIIASAFCCVPLANAQTSGGTAIRGTGNTAGGTTGATAGGTTGATAGGTTGATAISGTTAPTASTPQFSGAISSTQLQPQGPNQTQDVPRNDLQTAPGVVTGGAVSSTTLGAGAGVTAPASGATGTGIGAGTSTGLGIGAGSSTGIGIGAGSSSTAAGPNSGRYVNGAWIPHQSIGGNLGSGQIGGGILGGGSVSVTAPVAPTPAAVPGQRVLVTTPGTVGAMGAANTGLGGVGAGNGVGVGAITNTNATNNMRLYDREPRRGWTNSMHAAGANSNSAGAYTNATTRRITPPQGLPEGERVPDPDDRLTR